MSVRISTPELNKDMILTQKVQYRHSKMHFCTSLTLFLFSLILAFIIGNFWINLLLTISIIDIRNKYISYKFQKAMLLFLASESLTKTFESVLE